MKATVTAVITMCPTSLVAAGAPAVMSARDVIGKASHSSATIPCATSRSPVTRRARRPPAARRTPIPNATISAGQTREDRGEEGLRRRARRGQLADGLRQRVVALVQAGRDDVVDDDVQHGVEGSAGKQDLRQPSAGRLLDGAWTTLCHPAGSASSRSHCPLRPRCQGRGEGHRARHRRTSVVVVAERLLAASLGRTQRDGGQWRSRRRGGCRAVQGPGGRRAAVGRAAAPPAG